MPTGASTIRQQRPMDDSRGRRRAGRPTLLEPGRREVLLEGIRSGQRVHVAARMAGLSPKTLDEWLRRGRGQDSRPATTLYSQLVDEVETARAHAEARAVELLHKAARRNPRYLIWVLENLHPDWRRGRGRPAPVEATAPVESALAQVLTVTPETLLRLERQRMAEECTRAHQGQDVEPPGIADQAVGRDRAMD
jgi:hypothetical protein